MQSMPLTCPGVKLRLIGALASALIGCAADTLCERGHAQELVPKVAGVEKKSPIGRIRYRDNPATGSYPVAQAWQRLKRWSEAKLPKPVGDDRPPASEEQLREFEEAVGVKLPNDVRESYRVYDGQFAGVGIVYGLEVLSLKESLHEWQTWSKGYAANPNAAEFDSWCTSFPDGFVRQSYFNKGWIPLTYDGSGNHIGVDLNPGPKGTRGQVIVFGRDDEFHTVLALSWGQFLTDLADELEAGNIRLDTTEKGRPQLDVDDPHKKHFHSVGIKWSRGKLGLRNLSPEDQRPWDKWHGIKR